jgi:hypothetical protein
MRCWPSRGRRLLRRLPHRLQPKLLRRWLSIWLHKWWHMRPEFVLLEGSKHVSFKPEVTNVRALHNLGSPAYVIVRSSVDSQSSNNILFLFLI